MAALSENIRGAALMTGSMAAFTANDAMMKTLSGELPLSQAIFLRGILTTVLMLVVARQMGALRFRFARRDWARIAVRTLTDVATAYFFLTALYNMPLANATAILQSLPLTVTLAGAVFLGEAVGWRRMVAILVGFVGVLMIVQPGAAGFTTYSIYALIAVALVTVRDLVTRGMSDDIPSITVALVNATAVMVVFGAASAFETWRPVSTPSAAALVGAAITIILAYTFAVAAMRQGEIGAVTPFRYTGLLWALLLGWAVFGDWPDAITLAGCVLIVASGLFTLYRERVVRRD